MAIQNDEGYRLVSEVRQFNRFYTARLGLLKKRYLDGQFSLTEARILHEVGANSGLTASALRDTLGLNAGYVSRILASLTRRKLLRQTVAKHDRREKRLSLSAGGEAAASALNEKSAAHIQELLANLSSHNRRALAASLAKVRAILSQPRNHVIRVARLSRINGEATQLLQEYYEAINVVQRDNAESIERIIESPCGGVWLAYLNDEPAGCVVLKPLSAMRLAAECKRLYVRPTARGRGIADELLDAQEEFARDCGLHWIYLDSYDDLKVAVALYRKRGYEFCERYNDNPQATLFLRKRIEGTQLELQE